MKGIYKFNWDYGRHGTLDGVFVAEDFEVANIINKTVDFGEVLGKHSQIIDVIEEDDITLISDDQKFIKMFEDNIGEIGYNPFDYIDK